MTNEASMSLSLHKMPKILVDATIADSGRERMEHGVRRA